MPVLIDVIRLAFWAIEFMGFAVYYLLSRTGELVVLLPA